MPPADSHDAEILMRYAENALSGEERAATDKHLLVCDPCREFLSFVREFRSTLRSAKPHEPGPNESHPDASLIVALVENKLDEALAQEVRAHLLFCDDCSDEFFLLQRLTREQAATAPWRVRIEHLRDMLLDLGQSYGIGTALGPLRIIAETPSFAMRGASTVDKSSKSVEVNVGENTYGVEFHVSSDGTVSCDLAGFRTPVKSPLEATILNDSGEKLAGTRTDKFGNGRISVPLGGAPTDCWLLVLACGPAEQQILFRTPET